MNKYFLSFGLLILFANLSFGQDLIPLDTNNWEFRGSTLFEPFKGKQAVYMRAGNMKLKNKRFLNGTIEFDMYLKEAPMFPGILFRANGNSAEEFYVRPHLSGKADANQTTARINGVSPWQLCFGPRYSFTYEYNYNDWTHVKLVVNGSRAQIYLDYSETPNLSWDLFLDSKAGDIILRGGGSEAIHIADVRIDENSTELVDFNPVAREPIENLIGEWEISDMFEEKLLDDPKLIAELIKKRSWGRTINVEEGTAANISRQQNLFNGKPGNTVFAKVIIESNKDQVKLLEFGYSDRVVAILNGKALYRGNNKWRSRDYRYLGTIGLFDAVYLNLKKGRNELLMAVSEDFGGWLITGRITDQSDIKIIQ